MKVALLTTRKIAESAETSAEECVRSLLPHLIERHEVEVFAAPDIRADASAASDGGLAPGGLPLHDVGGLDPLGFDQIVYAVGNSAAHDYMLPLVRKTGGVAALFDWCLADAARAAYPGLRAGGALQRWLTVREGGIGRDGEAALNRSVVRFADAFLLPSEELCERVLADRNDPTPTAVFDPRADPARVAERWSDALAAFPKHRAARRSIFRTFVDAFRERASTAAGRAAAKGGASRA